MQKSATFWPHFSKIYIHQLVGQHEKNHVNFIKVTMHFENIIESLDWIKFKFRVSFSLFCRGN